MNWLGFKAKLYVAGAAVMTVLGFFFRLQYVKNKAERMEVRAQVAESRVRQDKVIRKREKEVAEEYRSRETNLMKELEKDNDDFKGLDNLNNPNDW